MNAKRKLIVMLAAVIVIGIAAIGTVAVPGGQGPVPAGPGGPGPTPPPPPPPPPPQECGLIGTWTGHAASSMYWLGVQTPGSNGPADGEMLLNWTEIASYLLHAGYPDVTHMTPGHGVWQKSGNGPASVQYNYTWYAYGLDDSGYVEYSVRVSGVAQNTDCNDVSINYTYEVFDGYVLPQNMSGVTPVDTITGAAAETRVPLVTP